MSDILKQFQDFILAFNQGDANSAANQAFIEAISKEYAKTKEKTFTLEQVWDAVYKATEGFAITYDRHDLADDICDRLDALTWPCPRCKTENPMNSYKCKKCGGEVA